MLKTFTNSTHLLQEEIVVNKNEDFDDLYMYQNANEKFRPVLVEVSLNGDSIELELDTGPSLTVVNTETFVRIKNGPEEVTMMDSILKFKKYSGDTIKTLGKGLIPVPYKSQIFIL